MRNYPNERCKEIIQILLDCDTHLTVCHIAERLDVSSRTIRNDLQLLEDFFRDYKGIEILKKPRVGIRLLVDDEGKELLQDMVKNNKAYLQPYSAEMRQMHIIKRLLQSEGSYKMQVLANELHVSRITIYKDLEEVETWLRRFHLTLHRKQNYGIEVLGDEKNWRKAASELLTVFKDDYELKKKLAFEESYPANSRLEYENYIQIKHLFPAIDISKIEAILKAAEKMMGFAFADIAYDGLVVHIAISIQRLMQEKDVKMDDKQLSMMKGQKEFEIARWIADRVEMAYGISIPESEAAYIGLHVLGSKVQQLYRMDEAKDILQNMDHDITRLAEEVISLIGNILSVDFSKDEKLLIGLVLHLRPAINRLKYGLSLRNPLLEDIKENYPSVFGAAWATSVLFEKHFGVKVSEEEVGYLAIHIGASLERAKGNVRVVVVCSSGIGTAQLVAVRLEKALPSIEIVNIISAHEAAQMREADFDFIITTIPLRYDGKPVVHINPMVGEADIAKIKKYMRNIESTRKFNREALENRLNDLFEPEFIFTGFKGSSKEEIITALGKTLIDHDCVCPEFLQTALERERITSTAIGKGVAIPHGSQEYVKRPKIAMAVMENPVLWAGSQVEIVFLLALKFNSGNSIKKFFGRFHTILDSEEILDKIKRCSTSKEIYDVLVRKDDSCEGTYQ
ncbi:MAG: BglG family transcription antiterminator [Bacillota bacterium]